MFEYVQCALEVADGLKYKFSNFPPIFTNFNVSGADNGDYMREYAIENNLLQQPQRMLVSIFKLENRQLLLHYSSFISVLDKCTKI